MVPLSAFALCSIIIFIIWLICCFCCCNPKWFCRNPTEFELVKDEYNHINQENDENPENILEVKKENNFNNHDPMFYIEELAKRDEKCSCRRFSFNCVWIIFICSLIPIILGIISLL